MPPLLPPYRNLLLLHAGIEDSNISVEPPAVLDNSNAIRKLLRGRTPGSDGISDELLQAARDLTGSVEESGKKSVCHLNRKKELHCPCTRIKATDGAGEAIVLSLCCLSPLVTIALILKRINPLLLSKRSRQKAGFIPQRSTRNCILRFFTLTVLAQKRSAFRKALFGVYSM